MPESAPLRQPMVSVLVVTYQHAQFIAECLEGILMQQTTFPVEVLVGEDASTDGTREICQRYAAAYPDRIRLFLRRREDVLHIMGRPTGRANFISLLESAKGRYITLCEGDDYWIDPDKLQRQVNALESDPEAAACFTNAYNEQLAVRTEYLDGNYTPRPRPRVEQSELINGQGLPTCTVLFRATTLQPLPKDLSRSPTADTLLYVQASNFGYFIYQPYITAVRRMHAGGLHSLSSLAHKYLTTIRNLPFLDEASHYRHHAVIVARKRRIAVLGWALAEQEGHVQLAKQCWPVMASMRKEVGWSLSTTLRNYLKLYWPVTESRVGHLWDRVRGRGSS